MSRFGAPGGRPRGVNLNANGGTNRPHDDTSPTYIRPDQNELARTTITIQQPNVELTVVR